MYKLITFDANGTLLKLRYPIGHLYSAIASNFGIESDASKLESGFKQSWITMNEGHPNFGLSSIGWRNWWKNVVFQTFMKTHEGNAYSENNLEPVANELIDIFSSDEGWDVADSCLETMDSLKSKQINIGVISNFDPRLHSVLKALKIHKYFDFVITSYEVNIMKPDIRIFRLAEELSKINLEGGQHKCILHVGDKLEFDYFGPLMAGWDAAIISQKKDTILALHTSIEAKKVFRSLLEFKEFL